ncbi:LOW QUALITY PROTEIN: hypothetical protein U9M48_032821, partial [Paspalum notatum var. saurae]
TCIRGLHGVAAVLEAVHGAAEERHVGADAPVTGERPHDEDGALVRQVSRHEEERPAGAEVHVLERGVQQAVHLEVRAEHRFRGVGRRHQPLPLHRAAAREVHERPERPSTRATARDTSSAACHSGLPTSSRAVAAAHAQSTTLPVYPSGTLIRARPFTATRSRVTSPPSSPRALVTHRHRWATRHSAVPYGRGARADARDLSSDTSSRVKCALCTTTSSSSTTLADRLPLGVFPPCGRGRGRGALNSTPRCSNSTRGGTRGEKRDARSCTGAGSMGTPRVAWPHASRKWHAAWPSATAWCMVWPTASEPHANRVTWTISSRASAPVLGCRLSAAGVGSSSAGMTLASATSAVASTNRAPASSSRIARLPWASTPSRPAHSRYSASAFASPASRTALGGAGGWKKFTPEMYWSKLALSNTVSGTASTDANGKLAPPSSP